MSANLHLARAAFWPLSLPVIIFFGLEGSVFLVLCLSLYANMASDISAYQGAKAREAADSEGSDGG